ncbi:hypothetical protein BJ944DRAFT_270190 [Cunninghamella echinulata]|nr:hypothetical protein BJ944DRAFT_270190 [Cunninghamella echinulata]
MDYEDSTEILKNVLPIYFRLLYNWQQSTDLDPLLQNKVQMFAAFQVELNNTHIYRLIDHGLTEHQHCEHWVSAGQLWKACGLTITEGLFLFQLSNSDYHLNFLQQHFPYHDVWVSVTLARSMAASLGVLDQLEWFLDQKFLSQAFSVDQIDRHEIIHNWRMASIPHTNYSTRALLDITIFPPDQFLKNEGYHQSNDCGLELLLPNQRKWRTQITRHQYQSGMVMKDRLESGIVQWQVWSYEQFLESQQHHIIHSPSSSSATSPINDYEENSNNNELNQLNYFKNHNGNIFLEKIDKKKRYSTNDGSNIYDESIPVNSFWNVAQGLLCDIQTLTRQHQNLSIEEKNGQSLLTNARVFSDNILIGNMPLKPTFLRQSFVLQHIYLSVMLEKIHIAIEQLGDNIVLNNKQKGKSADKLFPPSSPATNNKPELNQSNTSTQSEKTNTSSIIKPLSTQRQQSQQRISQMDPHMMIHDRMDLLEQDMYRIKKRAKKKNEDIELKWMELQHQINTLDHWKRVLETRQRNERAWMLLIIVLLLIIAWMSK